MKQFLFNYLFVKFFKREMENELRKVHDKYVLLQKDLSNAQILVEIIKGLGANFVIECIAAIDWFENKTAVHEYEEGLEQILRVKLNKNLLDLSKVLEKIEKLNEQRSSK